MPWAEAFTDVDDVKRMLDAGLPDMNSGIAGKVWETEQYFKEMLAPYPKLSQTVRIGCPDAQGPFNTAVNIAGVNVYYLVNDEPELVHNLMRLFQVGWLNGLEQSRVRGQDNLLILRC